MIGKRDDTGVELVVITLPPQGIRNEHRKPKTEEIEIERKKRRREGEKSKIVEILAFYCVWSMKPTAGGPRTAEP